MVGEAISFLGDFPTCFSFALSNPQHRRFHNQAKPGKRFFGPPPPRRWHILPTNQPSIKKSSRISLRRGRKIFPSSPFPPVVSPFAEGGARVAAGKQSKMFLCHASEEDAGGGGKKGAEISWLGVREKEKKSHTLTQDAAFLASNARGVPSPPLFQSIQSTKLGLLSICRPGRKRQVWRPGSVGIH